MKTKSVSAIAAGFALCTFAAGQAFADSEFADHIDDDCGTISFTGQQASTGNGFGTILGILSLQDKDNDNTTEAGYVVRSPDNGGEDETGGETGQGSGSVINVTRTAQEFIDLGWTSGDSIGIVFNVNQVGSLGGTAVTMDKFVVYAFEEDGTLLACWVWDGNNDTYDVGDEQGQGGDGWLFLLNDDAEGFDLETFMATSTNRFGMEVLTGSPISGANDGAEDFYIGVFSGGDDPTPIPLPPAALMGFAALGGLGIASRIRNRRRQES